MISPHLRLSLNLPRIQQNAQQILAKTKVELWPTLKANAYGLGAPRIAAALADLVTGFCLFSFDEVAQLNLHRLTGKPVLILGPPAVNTTPEDHLAAHARPAVSTPAQAQFLRKAHPILCVDTGMQRFACPPGEIGSVLKAGDIQEAFTHATRVDQARKLVELIRGAAPDRSIKLHAAASSLLDEPTACLDAVRPGLALYRGAVRISTRLVEARRSLGPIGYSGWISPTGQHGVILAGYAHGLRPGPCLINGQKQRLTEVGMQTAYLTLAPTDAPGDEVILLGDPLTESEIAFDWGATPHQVLWQLAGAGTMAE